MKLVIVESPTKAKTISRFLGSDFVVRSSFGHVRDLPKTKLGIDTKHDFKPTYVIPAKAKKVLTELKDYAAKANDVILATDEDREGEAIAWHLAQALHLNESDTQRIVFHEITKSAINHALEKPRAIDHNLVDAQQARRVLDRLVGYELSPFLWKKIRSGLSAGRVQSVAVRLVVEREREINAFTSQEYWTIEADLAKQKDDHKIHTKLHAIDDKAVGKLEINNQATGQEIVTHLDQATWQISDIQKKETKRTPAPPFTTSTLQQEAARKFGMSAKQTMMLAQQLYEGIDIGEHGTTGLITYMRTDSVNLAQSALAQAQEVIAQHFGKDYTLTSPRYYANRSKGAQEAHEAIRPTNLAHYPESIKKYLDKNQYRLYDLIWKRTIASQMREALFDQTTVDIDAKPAQVSHRYTFRANGQIVIFDGFIKAYTEGRDDKDEDQIEGQLPELVTGELLRLLKLEPLQHFTEPPARYSDATLIKALEAHGIGRPSTYAPTLTTIQTREYVEKEDKKYHPTEIGTLVNDMLVENFPEIVDINFTSHVEEELDDIAEGKVQWVPVIEEFYTPFKQHLKEKEVSVAKIKEESDIPCNHCGKHMMIKYGRMGKFLVCPDDPKITQPMPEEAALIKKLEAQTAGEVCPICGKPMVVKRGRFGYFLGCSDYPQCKGIAKIQNKIGFKCPNCLARHSSQSDGGPIGDVVEKKSRGRGKPFYACSRWPECTFITNKKPSTQEELTAAFEYWKANPPKVKTRIKTSYKAKQE